jgi:hypothetical protein
LCVGICPLALWATSSLTSVATNSGSIVVFHRLFLSFKTPHTVKPLTMQEFDLKSQYNAKLVGLLREEELK